MSNEGKFKVGLIQMAMSADVDENLRRAAADIAICMRPTLNFPSLLITFSNYYRLEHYEVFNFRNRRLPT